MPPQAPFPVGPLHNKATSEPRVGDTCPVCKEGRLDYDGLLNLACTQCGYSLAGCFT